MLGKRTLFVPGFDHAGISTQSVVEKRLFKTQGKTRHDLGREKFLETVMDWKTEYVYSLSCFIFIDFCSSYQGRITSQLYRLGCSYDWDRVAFTMNEVCSPFSSLKSSLTSFFLESQQSSYRNFL